MKITLFLLFLLVLTNCNHKPSKAELEFKELPEKIKELKIKHHLTDFEFDTECIYSLGDLSNLLKSIIDKTIPEKEILVTERISDDGKFFVATVSNRDTSIQISTYSDSDWISDEFMEKLPEIPGIFKSHKRYYIVNPAVGLTGQEAWFFCGLEDDLRNARKEGLPLLFPGEDPMDTEEYRKYKDL